MSKLGCKCGHVIVDQTDRLPYKGSFINAVDEDSYFDEIEAILNSLQNFNSSAAQSYSQVIDKITSAYIQNSRDIYECTQCGRLWMQTSNNHFIPFKSESGEYEAILVTTQNNQLD